MLREAGLSSPWSVMGLATRVAELIGDLKAFNGSCDLIESLNNAFDAYRAADLQSQLAERQRQTELDFPF